MTETWPIFLIATTLAIVFIVARSLWERSRYFFYALVLLIIASAAQLMPRVDLLYGKIVVGLTHYLILWFVYLRYRLGPGFIRRKTDKMIIEKIEKERIISRIFIKYGNVPFLLSIILITILLAIQGSWP